MWREGTSSLTTCRIWKALNFLITQGPMIKLMRRAVRIEQMVLKVIYRKTLKKENNP
jgi:hypothetical protein